MTIITYIITLLVMFLITFMPYSNCNPLSDDVTSSLVFIVMSCVKSKIGCK